MSDTTLSMSLASSPSAMTLITGSVPDGRMTRRPSWPSFDLPSSMALRTAGGSGDDDQGRGDDPALLALVQQELTPQKEG